MDGTSFGIDIPVSAAGVEPAAAAVARLSEKLTASSSAAAKAAEAVKAGEAAYRETETTASKAASALEKINAAADSQATKIAKLAAGNADGVVNIAKYNAALEKMNQLTARQAEASTKAASSVAAMNAAAASVDKLRNAATAAATSETNLAKALDKAKKAAALADKAAATGKVNEMAEGFGKLGGPLGSLGQKAFGAVEGFKKLGSSLGTAGLVAGAAVAIVAVAAAIVALTAAAVGGIAAIAAWSVSLGDAARTQGLLAAGITKSVKGGEELTATIANLQSTVPATSDELMGMAKKLAESGLQGKELAAALEETAIEAAKLKFGPNFAKQLLSLDSQTAKLKRSISTIFGGLKIEALLEGLAKMVALFDDGSSSANAIKVLFESLFQPLVDGVTGFIPKMVAMFIQFEILVMKAAIAIKPWGSMIAETGIAIAILAGIILGVLVVAVAAALAPLVLIGAAMVHLITLCMQAVGEIQLLGAAITGGAGMALEWLSAKFGEVVAFLGSISLSEIGTAMIQGLIDGITGAASGILTAITGAVGGAIDGAKSLLGIASPSKVFAEIGMNTGAGMAEGVDDATGTVQSSLEALVAPPAAAGAPGAPGASAKASGGGAGGTYVITINGGDSQSIAAALRDLFADLNVQAGTAAANG